MQAGPVGCRIVPKIHAERGGKFGDAKLSFEIEGAVTKAVSAYKLKRLTAVGCELVGNARKILAGKLACFILAIQVAGNGNDLGEIPGAVVVGGAVLQFAVLHGGKPAQVVGKPLANQRLVVARECWRAMQQPQRVNQVDEAAHVNQAGAGAVVAVVAKADLGILEGRVDARGRRDEPRANPLTCAAGAVFAVLELPRLGQRFDRLDYAIQSLVIAEGRLLAICVAVASNERQTVRTRRIGPPVAAIADVIVRITGGRRTLLVNNRGDGKIEGFAGVAGNRRRVQCFDVSSKNGGKDSAAEARQTRAASRLPSNISWRRNVDGFKAIISVPAKRPSAR